MWLNLFHGLSLMQKNYQLIQLQLVYRTNLINFFIQREISDNSSSELQAELKAYSIALSVNFSVVSESKYSSNDSLVQKFCLIHLIEFFHRKNFVF
jgi:hypothetical protein